MDYTADQQENLHPGSSNFDLLMDIYGSNSNKDEAFEQERSPSALRPNWNRRSQIKVESQVSEFVQKQFNEAALQTESMACVECTMALPDGYEIVAHRLGVME